LKKSPVAIIGSGFLASNLILKLELKGYPIRVFSRSKPKVDIKSTTVFHAIDLTIDSIDNKYLVGCEKLFFMLSIGTPGHQNSIENFEMELKILKSIVKTAMCGSIRDLYFISSSAVYGDQYNKPITEDDKINPISEYAKYKVLMENHLLKLCSDTFNPVIFRVSNPYGKFQYSQGIVNKLISAFNGKHSISIDNQGQSIRDYINIKDCISMMVSLMESNNRFNLYNFSTGIGTSTNELITIFKNHNPKLKVVYVDEKPIKPSISILSNSRVFNEISKFHITKIQDGIARLLN
jgi:UDP-glucose 4-epimerase